ncbi:MAG TPA: hypothetical protein VKV28_17305 [Candidatus Binataceae bacterium]|nr:hypothetical protein [Candidatus Binataceae bacterium]
MSKVILALLVASALFAVAGAQGCASGQQTQTTVTRSTSLPADNGYNVDQPAPETTTTTTTTTSRPDSLLGATAHAVATAIELPFRLVGDAIGLIL